MKVSITRIFALLTLTAACVAQQNYPGIELLNNNWPTDPLGYNFYPDLSVTYASRAKTNTGGGIPGIPYAYTFKQYAGQGYHTHETANGCCTITRPDPVWIVSSGQTTDAQKRLLGVTDAGGYANGNLQFNSYAGAYTVCIDFYGNPAQPLLSTFHSCVNNVTRYSTGVPGFGGRHFLERYTGGLPPYDGTSVNKPQNLHIDSRHSSASNPTHNAEWWDGYTSIWVTSTAHQQLLGSSSRYKTNALIEGYPDLLEITRASLPDGGIYDGDKYGIAPLNGAFPINWNVRPFEEHARGVEADIVLPITQLRSTFFEALYWSKCKPGIFQPDGPRITQYPPDPFWETQGIVHVNCVVDQFPSRGGIRAK